MLDKINTKESKKKLIVYTVLIFATIAVYWQVYQFEFIDLDDQLYVSQNIHIQSRFTMDGLQGIFKTRHADLWNPMLWLSFMLDYQIYGLSPGGYHVTNLILHILSTLLLFWLFNRMTLEIWKSAFVAALFALHPLHVESVAWIAERKDVLSTFFWMTTLCLYVRYTEKVAVGKYFFVLVSFVLALMSKPMVITLPVIMILLDYWPLKRFESRNDNLFLWQIKEKLPFLILSAIVVIITFYNPNGNVLHKTIPLETRIANAPLSFVIYLIKTFWPHDLAIFYPFPAYIPIWKAIGASSLIIGITLFVFVFFKRLPHLFIGWFWFMVTISPVIGIIQISAYSMADHYHYIPSIGITIMLAWQAPLLFSRESSRKMILFPTAILFITIISILSWNQCQYWKNSEKLFSHSLKVTKNNTMIHNLLGYSLFNKGKIQEAIYHYDKAILIAPDYFYAFMNRADAYFKIGKNQLANADYNKAVFLQPAFVDAYFKRGIFYGKTGKYQLAINDFSKAIRLQPDYIDAYNNRGLVLNQLCLYTQAINDFDNAIRLKPAYANTYNNRAFSYLNLKDMSHGCSDAKKACDLGNCKTLEWAQKKGFCN